MAEHYRGRIMHRITRPDRQAYVARATLANGHFVEAIFDTPDYIAVDGATVCDIAEATGASATGWITLGHTSYPLGSYRVLKRGETTSQPPPREVLRLAERRATPYGLAVSAYQNPGGLWAICVLTPRGRIDVPVIPGDLWEHVLELAGLGATVGA